MEAFLYESHESRVKFGRGLIREAGFELEKLGGKRALVITTAGRRVLANSMAALLGERCAAMFTEAVQHVPVKTVDNAMKVVRQFDVDSFVPVGGGSSIGLAKALALKTGYPILAIPTTYAGSEMTPIWGITENGQKKTGKSLLVRPKTVIYDPEVTVTLPSRLTATSGINAVAHCVEGLYAENANPVISLLAEEGIRVLCSTLPALIESPKDVTLRTEALYGTWLGSLVLGSVGMALHHKLCHVLGGSYNLQHAETHAVILPYALWYNSAAIRPALEAIARALNCEPDDVAASLYDLTNALGVPVSLKEIGMKKEQLDEAADIAVKHPYYNPRPLEETSIRHLLEYAFYGERPKPSKLL
ncbi:maleylacetate reductase [Alkalihalobacillus oceani]|uniref:Maleylacetate reductase n=1 Tax=Halalkalibacter oceani TaxID=1653776 RepID=A0A9X2DNV9_9BACI|nr:maleylacetate reductase [Halalkalibacter oceani]MCM3713370.1 maleylacetate reductase [Halalkalibacter oceani]